MSEVSLPNDKFSIFLTIVSMMQQSCDNMLIKGGKICQSSSRKSSIFDIDLEPLVGDIDLIVSRLESKKDLLETFRKQEVDMTLEINENNYIFRDRFSRVTCHNIKPEIAYKMNVPVSDLDKTLKLDDVEIIFEYTMNRMMIDRISSFRKALSARHLVIEGKGDKVNLKINTSDKSLATFGTLATIDDLQQEFSGILPYYLNVVMTNVESIVFTLYSRPKEKDYLLKMESSIGTSPEIPITVWALSNQTDGED